MVEYTRDTLFDGDLICYQSVGGYRFSVDSILLAHFCCSWKGATVLDMGCGTAILGLILLYRNPHGIVSLSGIEYQESLYRTATKNVEANGYSEKLTITHGDYKNIDSYYAPESFSHVITNPPFYTMGHGRLSKNKEALIARHQSTATTAELIRSISFVLKNRGVASLIYPAHLSGEVIRLLYKNRLEPKRIRYVFSYPESDEANLLLVECMKNGGTGVTIVNPLYIYSSKNGEYSHEVQTMFLPAGV